MRILIAEDERITRTSLTRQLQLWQHEVTAAEDGQAAWELFSAGEFDIVITDWEMPRLSGVDFIRNIRATPRAAYSYLILLTGRSDKSDIVNGIEAGANDFVSKPFDREELRVRVLAGERVVTLERALSRQNAELRAANERILSGLRAAARVQQSMLPRRNISTSSARSAWKYVPTDEVAGDAIALHLIDDRYLLAYVLDVSGHGVPAALLSVSAMHSMEPVPPENSLLRDMSGVDTGIGTLQRPAKVAAELNRRFRATDNDGRYLTMILCILDTVTGRLHFASAGHPSPFLIRAGARVDLPDIGGFPIAMMDGSEYEDGCVQLQPGDRLCLYSDGVPEQTDPTGEIEFGLDRVLDLLVSRTAEDPDSVVAAIVSDLTTWSGGSGFGDDVSLVVLDWLGPARA